MPITPDRSDPVIVQVRDVLEYMSETLEVSDASLADLSTTKRYITTIIGLTNSSAINAGTASNGLALSATVLQYHRCFILAKKRAAADHTVAGDNTGTVYLNTVNNVRDSIVLAPGAWFELPEDGDLADWLLMVATANDGIIVIYSTEDISS